MPIQFEPHESPDWPIIGAVVLLLVCAVTTAYGLVTLARWLAGTI